MPRDVEARRVQDSSAFGVAIAVVAWRADELFRIVLVRRRDGAVARFDVPDDLARALAGFDREAVVRNRWAVEAVVRGHLVNVGFSRDVDFGNSASRRGARRPSSVIRGGSIRSRSV